LAKIKADNPLSWEIIDSFLKNSDDWRNIGHSPAEDAYLSQYSGLLKQQRDSLDRPIGAIQNQNFFSGDVSIGGYRVVIDKPGPQIALIMPSAARMPVLSLAPRMLISIYGSGLADSTVTLNGEVLVLNYSSDRQINALVPANTTGFAKITVNNSQGRETVNVWIEQAAPAIFTMDGSGTGTAASYRVEDFITMFLTGLGTGAASPEVTLNGSAVRVTYAGPAPGFPGLDQINFQLPAGQTTGIVRVRVGNRVSNAVALP
jgi:uncharacterized protein (TIGR03437 family)